MTALAESRLSLMSPLIPNGTVPPDPATAAQWDRIVGILASVRTLEDDWDGQGSTALNLALVDHAIRWVAEMRRWRGAIPPRHAAPGTAGELILEWRGESYHLVAELDEPGYVDWLLDIPGQPVKQWRTDFQTLWVVSTEHHR